MKKQRLTTWTSHALPSVVILTKILFLGLVSAFVVQGFVITTSSRTASRSPLAFKKTVPPGHAHQSPPASQESAITLLRQQQQQQDHDGYEYGCSSFFSPTHHDCLNHHDDSSSSSPSSLRVGIAGAGAIALATAALLQQAGHDPMLWSPSGKALSRRSEENKEDASNKNNIVYVTGKLELQFTPRVADSAQTLVEENDIIVIALPANGHKTIMDAMVPHLHGGQHVIISSHSSLGALYLQSQLQSQMARQRQSINENDNENNVVTITAWGTTVCTARRPAPGHVRINTVRTAIDLCTLTTSSALSQSTSAAAAAAADTALSTCQCLFPQIDKFVVRDGLLAISLSNLNPQNHLGIALGNISRMEKGEEWYQSLNITPAIGRLLESLDAERLAIADALGVQVKTIFEHFSLSFHVPITDSIADMNQQIHQLGNDVHGPNTADSRYILEDVPFGLVPTIVLGRLVGRPATLHEAGVALVSSMYGRDFHAENDLLQALHLESMTLPELKARVQPPAAAAAAADDDVVEEEESEEPSEEEGDKIKSERSTSKNRERMTESFTR